MISPRLKWKLKHHRTRTILRWGAEQCGLAHLPREQRRTCPVILAVNDMIKRDGEWDESMVRMLIKMNLALPR